MNRIFYHFILLLASFPLFGQTGYSGFIDKYPIELVTYIYSDGDARAVYAYSNYDTPIVINGRQEPQKLTLYEKDRNGKNTGTLTFDNFDPKSEKLEGIWTDLNSDKKLTISLTKNFDIDYGKNIEWRDKELMQSASLKNTYFKLVISKATDDYEARVTGIKILEKKTDRLIQHIKLECQVWGLDNIRIEDYNFDGNTDFSVFEQSYAGPNTSRIYFLYNPKTNQFIDSGFTGTSLEFNSKTKRIHEYNQCCAGTSHMNAEYKLVNNRMVLVKQTCLTYDEKTGDFKKVKCD